MSDNGGEKSRREKIMEIRLACERRIRESRERTTRAAAIFDRHLQATRDLVQENHDSLEKLDQLKEELAEVQADLARALSVKTKKETKMNIMKSDLAKKEEEYETLKELLSEKRNKEQDYASLLANSLSSLEALETEVVQDELEKEDINAALAWYKNVLGFQIAGRDGVKFIFNKIDSSNPEMEYSFKVKLENDKYCLLQCDPSVEGTDELLKELNETNDVFRFVRVMREKFTSSVPTYTLSMTSNSVLQACSSAIGTVTAQPSPVESSPVMPPAEPSPSQVVNTSGKGKKGRHATPSSSVRRSARLRG